MPANTDQNEKISELKLKGDKTTDDSLESSKRMLQLCDESKDAGFQTLIGLDEQGEKLDKVDEDMDQINVDMREAEKNLTGMEKICGMCVYPWAKKKRFKEDVQTWRTAEDCGVVSGQPTRVVDNRKLVGPAASSYIARETGDARGNELEDNMAQVGSAVGNLRSIAVDMGEEIVGQNSQLERINHKASSNESRVMQANMRATNLIR